MSTTTLKVVIAVLVVLLAAAGWQIAMMANKAAELEVQSAFLDAAFEAEIDQADQELAAAQSRIEEPEALLAEISEHESAGTAARQAIKKVLATNAKLKAELEKAEESLTSLEQTNADLQASAGTTNGTTSAEIATLRTALEEAQSAHATAEQEQQTLTAKVSALEAAVQTSGDADGQSSATDRERIDGLVASLAEAETQLLTLEQMRAQQQVNESANVEQIKSLEAANQTLRQQQQQLNDELAAAQAEQSRLAAAVEESQQAANALDDELGAQDQALLQSQQDAAALNARYEQLLNEKSTLAGLNATQRAELERVRAALEQAQGDVARLTNARGIYTVKEGDSLSIIAAFFYANGNLWPRIMEANHFLIGDDPDLIYPQIMLVVP